MEINHILAVLEHLPKKCFDVHTIDDAWYSEHAISNAFNVPTDASPIRVVRVGLKDGMLELHPIENDLIEIKCYCCFDGNPKQGCYRLDQLRNAVLSLKEHYCPPWPG